jgi:hypothetical protein
MNFGVPPNHKIMTELSRPWPYIVDLFNLKGSVSGTHCRLLTRFDLQERLLVIRMQSRVVECVINMCVPSGLLFSVGSALVGCLTSMASSMTRFMNSSKPWITVNMNIDMTWIMLGTHPDLSLDADG